MRKVLYWAITVCAVVGCFSCQHTKIDPPLCCGLNSNTNPIVGKWNWVSESQGNIIDYDSSSGVKKSLNFTSDGHVYITYNDASGSSLNWFPTPALLGRTVTDTASYHFEQAKAPCVNFLYTAVVIDSAYYQLFLSHDTLQFSPVPCLAPLTSTYIRGK